MTVSFIDIVIIVGICQGVFLSIAIQNIDGRNRDANRILSWIILICTAMMIGRILMIRFFNLWVFQWSILFDIILFLFGPLFYLYTRKLLLDPVNKQRLLFVHYVPALLFGLIAIYYVSFYSTSEYYEAYQKGELDLMFHLWLVAGLISNFYYLISSFKVLQNFKKTEKHVFSFEQNALRYLQYFLSTIMLILVIWLFSYINSMWLDRYIAYIGYDILWLAIPVFIYVIGYYSLRQPELFRVSLEKRPTEVRERLSSGEASVLKQKLDSLMKNEQLYLQNDLTLRDVAEKLHTSTNNISWLLNHSYKITFYDFINGFRIRAFVDKVAQKEHLQRTILALSMDVGFNSKSTFNKAFKQAMNETPSNFIKKQQAA